jgi:Pentapeptide repeats (8 copies)
MICSMPDQGTKPAMQSDPALARVGKTRWLGRLSPWVWGLGILIVIGVIALTQRPRLAAIAAADAKARPAATAAGMPTLSGLSYTQAMVAGRDFARGDLRGARLLRLDLRGKSFLYANAAGAVFTGSLLNGANLSHADLRGADLRDTCLRGANLANADLSGADFTGADVTGAIVTPAATARAIAWGSISSASVCPEG